MIGLQVCFHIALQSTTEIDVSDTTGCLQVVKIYSFTKEIEPYTDTRLVHRLSLC